MLVSHMAQTLDGDNMYECDNCKRRHGCQDACCKHRSRATKQIIFRQIPEFVCITLQRFTIVYDIEAKSMVGQKLNFEIDFKTNLSIPFEPITQVSRL